MISLLIQYVQATGHGIGDIESAVGGSSDSVVAIHISDGKLTAFFDVAIPYRTRLPAEYLQVPSLEYSNGELN